MSEPTTYYSRMQQKYNTISEWDEASSFIPLKGEVIIGSEAQPTDGQDSPNLEVRIGDGIHNYNNIPAIKSWKDVKGYIDNGINLKYNKNGGIISGDVGITGELSFCHGQPVSLPFSGDGNKLAVLNESGRLYNGTENFFKLLNIPNGTHTVEKEGYISLTITVEDNRLIFNGSAEKACYVRLTPCTNLQTVPAVVSGDNAQAMKIADELKYAYRDYDLPLFLSASDDNPLYFGWKVISGTLTGSANIAIRSSSDDYGTVFPATGMANIIVSKKINVNDYGAVFIYVSSNAAFTNYTMDFCIQREFKTTSPVMYDANSEILTGDKIYFNSKGYAMTTLDNYGVLYGYSSINPLFRKPLVSKSASDEIKISIPCSNNSDWLLYTFKKYNSTGAYAYTYTCKNVTPQSITYKCTSRHAAGWRLRGISLYDQLRINQKAVIVNNGEIEAAIRIEDRPDYSGMENHGNEIAKQNSTHIYIDGQSISESDTFEEREFSIIQLIEVTEMYDPGEETDQKPTELNSDNATLSGDTWTWNTTITPTTNKFAEHYKVDTIDAKNNIVTIENRLKFMFNTTAYPDGLTMRNSYLFMLPILRKDSAHDNVQVTDYLIDNQDFILTDCSTANSFNPTNANGGVGANKSNATKYEYNGNYFGLHGYAEIVKYSAPSGVNYVTNVYSGSPYNKLYYSACQDNTVANNSDEWKMTTKFTIDIFK